MRVVRVLEARTHEHFGPIAKDIDSAVAVVHVEIEYRDPVDAGSRERDGAPSATLLKKQKPIA